MTTEAEKNSQNNNKQSMSAVDFVIAWNAEVENFSVELSMEVTQGEQESTIVAGIMVEMGRSDGPAFFPSDILRQLADEADAMALKAVAAANNRG